jgi:outer membrane protein OmpA-like peptidoglycan-associated protein
MNEQLDALLSLLAELQDRRSHTITVKSVPENSLPAPERESNAENLDLEAELMPKSGTEPDDASRSPTLVNLPNYLKQLADEAGIDIDIPKVEEQVAKQPTASMPFKNSVPPFVAIESEIEDIEEPRDSLDEIADSIFYLQSLLLDVTPLSDTPELHVDAFDTSDFKHSKEPATDLSIDNTELDSLEVTTLPLSQSYDPNMKGPIELLQDILVQPEVAILQDFLAQIEQKIVDLEIQVNDPSALENLDQRLAAMQDRVSDTSAMENMQAEMSNLAKLQGNIPSQIATLREKLAALEQNLSSDHTASLSLGDRIVRVENSVGNLADLRSRITTIENLIGSPQAIIELLLPLLNNLVSREVAIAGEDFAKALAPIIDRIVDRNVQDDKEPMSEALAPILPGAIKKQIVNSPGEFANAIAPELGPAITDQVRNNADTMIDALYPIIGSTISRYIAEAIRNINDKVENTLSFEGVSRKIRAKLQGISEAELLLKEAISFKVQAVFLIHKLSGLVIAEAQPTAEQTLESDMIAGMLTAIRNFANDCIATAGSASELDAIDYGSFKILLEVAGSCYLAIVVEGEPPLKFIHKARRTLSNVIQEYHTLIDSFEGDPATVPEQISQTIAELVESHTQQKTKQSKSLWILLGLMFALVAVPWGWWQYRQNIERRLAAQVSAALLAAPELSVYSLNVEANSEQVTLQGRLPNQYLRSLAEKVAKTAVSDQRIDNQIVAVRIPADPTQTATEVERAIATFNQQEGTQIKANYTNGKVTVEGSVPNQSNAEQISQSLARIPGVETVVTTVEPTLPAVKIQIFFKPESAQLEAKEIENIKQVRDFLKRYPTYHLRIIGESDGVGTVETNQQLALDRARAVEAALIAQGVEPQRLEIKARLNLSIGEVAPQATERRVEFEIVKPITRNGL